MGVRQFTALCVGLCSPGQQEVHVSSFLCLSKSLNLKLIDCVTGFLDFCLLYFLCQLQAYVYVHFVLDLLTHFFSFLSLLVLHSNQRWLLLRLRIKLDWIHCFCLADLNHSELLGLHFESYFLISGHLNFQKFHYGRLELTK